MRKASILVTFTQLPQEPSSGAARSIRTICEFLGAGGWRVQVLGVTATEGAIRLDAQDWLRGCGIAAEVGVGPQSSRVFQFHDRGVDYVLLDVGSVHVLEAPQRPGDAFDKLFDGLLAAIQPNIFLTYGGWAADWDRRRRAHAAGSLVVFTVHNEAFMRRAIFDDVDAVFSASPFLASRYKSTIGVDSTPLPPPIASDEVTPVFHEPTFVTFINPEPMKGVAAFARIAEEVCCRHPEIPFLVVKSRSGEDVLIDAALAGGFDLRRHSNIVLADAVPEPSRIYGVTRVLLVPSLIEASGRVAAEALLNGIPVIASNRGGLPDTLNGGGFVVSLPTDMLPDSIVPPTSDAVRRWIELTIRLMTDDGFYRESARRAYAAGRVYSQEALVSAYCSYFEGVLRRRP
jgi:glycosyltransferase involved in cell wall biosynthesis